MKRYAFIDVQNTESTCLKVLGCIIDWQKTIHYLETKWGCEKIFLYPGIEIEDEERKTMFAELKGTTSEIKVITKEYKTYKNKDKILSASCPNCHEKISTKISMGYSWKCNCDVELTIDVLKTLNDEDLTVILLFSGDGDFELLIEEVIKKNIHVHIFSSSLPILGTINKKRISTKLKKMTTTFGKPVSLLEMNNIKYLIRKEPEGVE